MAGVEILAAYEVVTEYASNWTAFWVIFGIAVGVCLISGVSLSLHYDYWGILFFLIMFGIIIGLFFTAILCPLFATPKTYKNQYKVTISDEVSMNDFLEKYEIIDQEGKIYTIREK